MGRLPGWSFMLLGIAMIGYSKLIESKRAGANLTFFLWVGGALLAFGFFREVLGRLKKPAKRAQEPVGPPPDRTPAHHEHRTHPAAPAHHQSPHATHQHVEPLRHPSHPYEGTLKRCPRCHTPTPIHAKFCGSCGYRFY